jgi:hypothetical protein
MVKTCLPWRAWIEAVRIFLNSPERRGGEAVPATGDAMTTPSLLIDQYQGEAHE